MSVLFDIEKQIPSQGPYSNWAPFFFPADACSRSNVADFLLVEKNCEFKNRFFFTKELKPAIFIE